MVIKIKTNIENENYIDIDRCDLMSLVISESIPKNIKKIVIKMHEQIYTFEKQISEYVSNMCIRKDSDLAKFLYETKDVCVINKDEEVSYLKIVSAFNIAIYTDNKIYEKIYPLFKESNQDKLDKILKEYDKEVINYILENSDFDLFILKNSDNYNPLENAQKYIIYEDGRYQYKKIYEDKGRQRKLINKG